MEFDNFLDYKNKYGLGSKQLGINSFIHLTQYDSSGTGYVNFIRDLGQMCWHNLEGPAFISFEINEIINTEWWVNDNEISFKIKDWAEELGIDIDNLTDVDKALIKLTWADYDEK